MYSESDLDAAVAAGKLNAEEAAKFRAFIAAQKTAPAVDEEYVRLLTGFNDIFVSIALVLVLVALGFLAAPTGASGLCVAAASWGLAEYFTRKRRMALPSILLLVFYTVGVSSSLIWMIGLNFGTGLALAAGNFVPGAVSGTLLLCPALIGAAAYLHWRRFHVPITPAAGAGGIIFFGMAMLMGLVPSLRPFWSWLLLGSGLGVFALGLRWDISDLARTTRRTDVAFWLHLLAAPLIVHPLFHMLGLLNGGAGGGGAIVAIGVYLALGVVALLVDRRALLVSALGYVIYALSFVLKHSGVIGSDLSYTALVAGMALLMLSAFWHKAREGLLALTPLGVRQALPPV
ncbi:hypothetical protein [Acidocella aromatica]|uniref:DUF2157 domain-containing protein n=1 Tax=Acidocella aromatica TaxID=1303579 RepID=A0A840VLT1_9PROT|nr:hypothetical protein [Acidocella aromatica]MBB5374095.1 hypothetical protein [Acidocella aromatica]